MLKFLCKNRGNERFSYRIHTLCYQKTTWDMLLMSRVRKIYINLLAAEKKEHENKKKEI